MAVATQLANATWTGFSDCMAVVKTCKQNVTRQLDGRAMHAGIRKFAVTQEGWPLMEEVQHVRAHATEAAIEIMNDTDARNARRNNMVDLLAKEAVTMGHPQMSNEQKEIIEDMVRIGRKVLRTIMATLKCFPKSDRLVKAKSDSPRKEKVPKQKSKGEDRHSNHAWKWMFNKWCCVKCLKVTGSSGEDDEPPCWELCQPAHIANDMERALKCGHKLMVSQVEVTAQVKVSTKPLLWCK